MNVIQQILKDYYEIIKYDLKPIPVVMENKKRLKASPHMEHCKKYIFSHLHEKLTVQEIADALHLNPNYLSRLFWKQEGQTILQFVLKEKIKLAQSMLIYSKYTYR